MNGRDRRIRKELDDFATNTNNNFSINQKSDDLLNFVLSIEGPQDSPYENGIFLVDMKLPSDYPFKPPKIKFITKIYHPGILGDGRVCTCISTMENSWCPALTLSKIANYLHQTMKNLDDACNLSIDVSLEYKHNKEIFLEKARRFTLKYAI